jgi:hypothetical protein
MMRPPLALAASLQGDTATATAAGSGAAAATAAVATASANTDALQHTRATPSRYGYRRTTRRT